MVFVFSVKSSLLIIKSVLQFLCKFKKFFFLYSNLSSIIVFTLNIGHEEMLHWLSSFGLVNKNRWSFFFKNLTALFKSNRIIHPFTFFALVNHFNSVAVLSFHFFLKHTYKHIFSRSPPRSPFLFCRCKDFLWLWSHSNQSCTSIVRCGP